MFSYGVVHDFPSRRQLANIQDQLNDKLIEKIKHQLQKLSFLSITIDIWSRQSYSSSFLGVTAHFVSYDGCPKLKHILLGCRQIPQPHTSEVINDIYQQIMQSWEIFEDKIFRIVTDNGANIVKAFR